MADVCSIDGCDTPAKARGWCGAHYGRWRRHGYPLGASRPGRVRDAATDRRVRPDAGAELNAPAGIHGTRSRYRKGCRCLACRSAERAARARYRGSVTMTSEGRTT